MNGDQALAMVLEALRVTLWVSGPILAVALIAGLLVGVAQTVLQINEASVSFVVKLAALVGVLVVLGPMLASKVVDYTRGSLQAIEHVVR
ncbi:MAG: flagellar biosynthetic protein FliQ [Labilithrix sp.]|nr:flagellar biosynthetic protein FliQ [Labilithrix sp.]MBX3210419.1 flagellar biosynthetic protein FliQ [Labilithrix sp.]